jgi:hypothetical protein
MGIEEWSAIIGCLSSAYAAMAITKRTGITMGGTRYFMLFHKQRLGGSILGFEPLQSSLAPRDHKMMESTAAPRARQASNTIAGWYFLFVALARSRPGEPSRWCTGKSSTSRRLTARLSDCCNQSIGSRAIIDASVSAARALGTTASRAASSQGSRPSRVNAETTLSGIPFCWSPTAAKRKSFSSEWSSENRAGSAMIAPDSDGCREWCSRRRQTQRFARANRC